MAGDTTPAMTAPSTKATKRPGRPAGKPCTPAELAARQANAQLSTGPRTEAGKAVASRNAWKHGMDSAAAKSAFGRSGADALAMAFGKPCKRTCPYHPENDEVERPCSLVLDGLTQAGGNCLDKTVYVNALASLADAIENGEMSGVNAMMAAEGAKVAQILHELVTEISKNGMLIKIPVVTKEGKLVVDECGVPVPGDVKVNPLLAVWQKLLSDFGISLPEMLATPQARAKTKTAESAADAFQSLLGGIMQRAGRPQGPSSLPPPVDD